AQGPDSTPLWSRRRMGNPIATTPVFCGALAEAKLFAKQLLGGGDDIVGLEAEFPQKILQGRGSSERAHGNHGALGTDVAVPSERGAHLDRDTRADAGG